MISNPYVRIDQKFLVPYVPNENYAFMINFDTPITDADFTNFRLDLYNVKGVVIQGVGTLTQVFVGEKVYNISCSFLFPEVPEGEYQFVIYDSIKKVEKCRSNWILCTYDNDSILTKVEYKHKHSVFNFGYSEAVFTNIFSLPIFQVDQQFETERSQYRNATTGKMRNLRAYRDEVIKVESYYFDSAAHEAASAMYMHSDIRLSGVRVEPKSAYSIDTNQMSNLTKANIELYVVEVGTPQTLAIWSQNSQRAMTQNGTNYIQVI